MKKEVIILSIIFSILLIILNLITSNFTLAAVFLTGVLSTLILIKKHDNKETIKIILSSSIISIIISGPFFFLADIYIFQKYLGIGNAPSLSIKNQISQSFLFPISPIISFILLSTAPIIYYLFNKYYLTPKPIKTNFP